MLRPESSTFFKLASFSMHAQQVILTTALSQFHPPSNHSSQQAFRMKGSSCHKHSPVACNVFGHDMHCERFTCRNGPTLQVTGRRFPWGRSAIPTNINRNSRRATALPTYTSTANEKLPYNNHQGAASPVTKKHAQQATTQQLLGLHK